MPLKSSEFSWKPVIIIIGIVSAVILLGQLARIMKPVSTPSTVADSAADQQERDAQRKRKAEEAAKQRAAQEKTKQLSHWDSRNGQIEAFVMSQSFIKDRLKSPRSAEFPWFGDSNVAVIHWGDGQFIVKAYVDAQNSFGAMLRNTYVCELKDEGEDRWKLVSLVMGNVEVGDVAGLRRRLGMGEGSNGSGK